MLSREVALALGREVETWDDEKIVRFQLYEETLCMPFARFHAAVEAVLERPVWTHEFAEPDSLRAEYEGKRDKPTMNEILAMIPADKLLVVPIGEPPEETLRRIKERIARTIAGENR